MASRTANGKRLKMIIVKPSQMNCTRVFVVSQAQIGINKIHREGNDPKNVRQNPYREMEISKETAQESRKGNSGKRFRVDDFIVFECKYT
jgi:hypothetical protein